MKLGIIGGSGLGKLDELEDIHSETLSTAYGRPSAPLVHGRLEGVEVVFLPRHGQSHSLPPHLINYRANLAALKQSEVTHVIGVAAVGGITQRMAPQKLVVPDQIIDYTYGRAHTFSDGGDTGVVHVDFSYPYSETLRNLMLAAGLQLGLELLDGGCYGCTQGPRLETSAEILRMERDGCDLVGMTGMPEAVLARELNMDYACLAVVVNWAAGKSEGIVSMEEIERQLEDGMLKVRHLLTTLGEMLNRLSGSLSDFQLPNE